MKRVKKNTLEVRSNRYYFGGELFTGLVYSVVDELVEDIFYVENGFPSTKPNDVFGLEEYSQSINGTNLEDDLEEPFIYDGRDFCGVVYDFEDEFCVGARAFEGGYLQKEVSWFKSGVLGFYEGLGDGVGEFATWYEDGSRNNLKISEQGAFRLEADFNQPDEMRRLSIFGPFCERLFEISDKLIFPLVKSIEQFKEINLYESLYLSGDGISDEVFSALLSSDHFSNVNKLHLSNTSLSANSISALITRKNIKELVLEDNIAGISEPLKELQKHRPDCIIKFSQ